MKQLQQISALSLGLMVLAGLSVSARAQQGQEPSVVIEVRIEGNEIRSDESILATIKTRAGQEFNEQIIQGDERRLLQTRRYSSVQATKIQTDRGVIVTFRVQERPVTESISF
ncbi:MAG: POTRA domain-containing protein, partial [Planctomycetota bacterium]